MSRKIIASNSKDAKGMYLKMAPIQDLGPFKLDKFLFDKQLKFVEDPRPFKIAVCSRRAGKTVACAAHLIDVALNTPEAVCLYITLSRNNAKKLVWKELQKINQKYNLGATEDATELSMAFSNGAVVYCSGAKDSSEIEKFRGLALKLCYIDECQSFRPYIEDLIDDILAPALMDYAGTLCLIGTPGPVPAGFFAEVAGEVQAKLEVSESWSKHSWTFFDNPFITIKSGKPHQQLLDRELKRRRVSIEDPSIQREWFGKWVLDSDSLVLHYDPKINHYDELPKLPNNEQYNYILGIDLGFDDADALAVLAWSELTPNIYLVNENVTAGQGITELTAQIQLAYSQYAISKSVIDTGGLGKKIAEELIKQKGIPLIAADKTRKMENLAFLDDALCTGRFKAKSDSKFAQDSYLMEKDRAKSTPEKIKISDKYHSDIIDAVLYPFRECPAWAYEPPTNKPKIGSKEWAEAQQSEMFEAAQDHFGKQAALERHASGDYED